MTISVSDVLRRPLSVVKNIFRVDKLPTGKSFSLRQRLEMMNYDYIRLRIRYSKCHQETTVFGLESGSDEIAVGGVVIYHDFRTKIFYQKLGAYNTGTKKEKNVNLSGMSMRGGDKMTLVPLAGGVIRPFYNNPAKSLIPKYFGALVYTAELDFGGFYEWICDEVHPKVNAAAKTAKENLLLKWGLLSERYTLNEFENIISGDYLRREYEDTWDNFLKFVGGYAGWSDSIFLNDNPFIFTHIESYAQFPVSERGDKYNNSKNSERHFRIHQIGDNAHYELHFDWEMYK